MARRCMFSSHLESVCEGIAIVHENRVVADDPRPATDTGLDALERANVGFGLDAALEHRSDQAFLAESVADPQSPLAMELRHARRCSGAAGRAVDRLVAVEYGATAVGIAACGCVAP